MTVADLITELQRFPAYAPVVVVAGDEQGRELDQRFVEGRDILNVERTSTSLGFGVAIVART